MGFEYEGGIEAVKRAMEAHGSSTRVQEAGRAALQNLASAENEEA